MALRPISRVDEYEFPADGWDVRGWTVRTAPDEAKVGKVDDMLLDRGGGLRYLDVDLGLLKKHVLVPLEHAFADPERKTVWIEGKDREALEAVPEYALDPEALDEDYERRLDAVWGGSRTAAHRELVAPEEEPDGDLELRRMSQIEGEYRVAGDDPRGWTVVAADGRKVGAVAELLMDPGAMRARFLDVAVDEDELDLEPVDRHVLLPADRVRLDRRKKHVLVGGLLGDDLATYPQYAGLPLARSDAREFETFFDRAGTPDRPAAGAREPGHPPAHDWRQSAAHDFYRPRARRRTQQPVEDDPGGR